MMDAESARECAAALLEGLPDRWTHTEGVVRQARALGRALSSSEEYEALLAAAYLHDIGYAAPVIRTGFHPLDGARYLRALGEERLACLVAYHSGADVEASLRGLEAELAEFKRETSDVADSLTYCDVTTELDGGVVSVERRLECIARRRSADDPALVAFRLVLPELERIVENTERAIAARAAF